MWSWEIADTVTGERLEPVHLVENSWKLGLNSRYGSGSSVIETRDPMYAGVSTEFWQTMLTPWAYCLVGKWDGDPVWAHVITEPAYDVATGTMTLSHAEIPALIKDRGFWPSTAPYNPNARMSWGPATRGAIMRQVCRIACGGGYAAPVSQRRLPVLFDSNSVQGFLYKEVVAHEFETPWQVLNSYADDLDGVDFVFEARFDAATSADGQAEGLHWLFKTGTHGDLADGIVLLRSRMDATVSAPQGDVTSAVLAKDGLAQATGVWVTGEGSGADRQVSQAYTTIRPEKPAVLAYNNRSRTDNTGRFADAYIASFAEAPAVWSLTMRPDRILRSVNASPAGIRPGSRLLLDHQGDKVLGTSQTELYVTAMSGGIDGDVSVEVQLL